MAQAVVPRVSSIRRRPGRDLQSTQRYVSGDVYAHTKLLNLLASLALAGRLPAEQVTVNLIHPGMAWTQMLSR